MLVVTATELPRLMTCNGSRLMGGYKPPVDSDDAVRNEGNAAHWVIQQIHFDNVKVEDLVNQKAPNGVYVTNEMIEFLHPYIDLVQNYPNALIETDYSFGRENFVVNGRADFVYYDPLAKKLVIADLKYGWGIVEPKENWTLLAHAIGFMMKNSTLPVENVIFMIFQPRPHHSNGRIRAWEIDIQTLQMFHHLLINTLSNPSDILNTSVHCYKCPALAICPAARKAQMNAIDASENAFKDDIDNDNLSFQLDHVKRGIEMLTQLQKGYQELAIHRIKHGEVVNNYSLENDLTNRQWQDHVTPDLMQIMTGRDLTKKELLTPAQVEKAGVLKEIVAAFTERRNKGVKLVRVDADIKAKKLFATPERK